MDLVLGRKYLGSKGKYQARIYELVGYTMTKCHLLDLTEGNDTVVEAPTFYVVETFSEYGKEKEDPLILSTFQYGTLHNTIGECIDELTEFGYFEKKHTMTILNFISSKIRNEYFRR